MDNTKRYFVMAETVWTSVEASDPEEAKQKALEEFKYLGYTEEDIEDWEVEEKK
jgi:hypothetical protein